jgi:hypothetical protein
MVAKYAILMIRQLVTNNAFGIRGEHCLEKNIVSKSVLRNRKLDYKILLLTCVFSLCALFAFGDNDDSLSALPKPYEQYSIDTFSFSPDRHYAVILPKDLPDDPKNFLVCVQPFKVLSLLPTDAEFEDPSHRGGLVINWSKDSSAAVIYVHLKWGPKTIYVIRLMKDNTLEITNLDGEIRKLLQPDFIKANIPSFNDQFDYIFDSELEGPSCWAINEANQVVIDCVATSDPKNIPPSPHWIAHFTGLWNISKRKFDSHQFSSDVSDKQY